MECSQTVTTTPLRRIAAATFVGNMIEMYDWILYPFIAAQVFGQLFFPAAAPWVGTLAAIATQAIAFVVRPLGALLCGWIGDRYGRRLGLIITLVGMGVATLAIGLLPTYASIGIAAPILLIGFRLVQGLAVGGEWGGSVLLAVEHAPPARKTLFGAIPQIGSTVGMGLAAGSVALVSTTMERSAFVEWGWRIPFLVSAALIIAGIVVRFGIDETPDFLRHQHERPGSGGAGGGLAPFLATVLAWMAATIAVLLFAIQLASYAPSAVPGIEAFDVEIGMLIASVAQVPVMIAGVRWARHVGPVRVLITAGAFAAAWAFPGYLLVVSGSAGLLVVSMVVGLVPYGLTGSVIGAAAAARFPVHLRFRGLGLGFACATVIGGGLLPIPMLVWVRALDGSFVPLALASVAGGICTVVGALWLQRLPASLQATPPRPIVRSSELKELR